mgnify:FL=1
MDHRNQAHLCSMVFVMSSMSVIVLMMSVANLNNSWSSSERFVNGHSLFVISRLSQKVEEGVGSSNDLLRNWNNFVGSVVVTEFIVKLNMTED